uniref:Protein yippee-like n=1 Tax=Cyprinodon variegatus TaxID=28743 RepID=A0A3Q2G6E6_CYPVA
EEEEEEKEQEKEGCDVSSLSIQSFIVERFDDLSISGAAEQGQLMTFHCLQCNTILADSLTVCGEIKSIDSIMCIRRNKIGIYSHLKCRSCSYVVGRVIHAAPLHLTAIRSIFLLNKAMMSSYILDSSSMVKTSSLSFDLKPLQETVNEVNPNNFRPTTFRFMVTI